MMTAVPADSSMPTSTQAPSESHTYDVCVVGGGLAGMNAALAAARNGARTVLIQDRAVLGGNASSEIRMWALGAHGPDAKESGIMEEIRLANLYYNAERRFSVWDNVLYGMVREQENLDCFLSCAVCECTMDTDTRIASVRAWHLTRQCWLTISASAFIDCSGDSILRLSGAAYRWGREAQSHSAEPHGQEQADRRTMGNSILLQLREIDPQHHKPYVAPAWALPVNEETFPNRKMTPTGHNFWWLEIGGEYDTINDADKLRDDLTALAHGVWAFIKNHPDGRGHAWELEWIGALPGKRENIRYEGDHILTEMDINNEGKFDDIIAHGGWTMDDHPPAGIFHPGKDTTHHPAPSPYGIPYRSLYSRNISNLWFAGRNISATHMAMSSTRVMATCATMGQAAGTAASIAIQQTLSNRGVYEHKLHELQNRLMDADQWLPGRCRSIPAQTQTATLSSRGSDPETVRDGIDRRTNGELHRWEGQAGDWIQFAWDSEQTIEHVRITGDSKLAMLKTMPCSFPLAGNHQDMPANLPRDLRVEVSSDGQSWSTIHQLQNNYRRHIAISLAEPVTTRWLRVVFSQGWSNNEKDPIRVFACECGLPNYAAAPIPSPWPKQVEARGGRASA